MQAFPHHYKTAATTTPDGTVTVSSDDKPDLVVGPPKEFGGTGELWSPEDLLVAAVTTCFALSFKAVAQASLFDWISLSCSAEGTLEKVDRSIEFTAFRVHAVLTVDDQADVDKAKRYLEKAETICLITNSTKASSRLSYDVVVAERT